MPGTAIIGDVHGCLVELQRLVGSLKEKGVDEFIFVGDLVDKGPDSAGVLRFVRSLGDENTVIVQGNHENKNFRFWKKVEADNRDKAMEMKGAEELSAVMESTDQDLRDWLRHKVVPYFRKDFYTVVHGGITPKLESLPDDPSTLSGKEKKRVDRVMYTRYVNDAGSMVVFGEETGQDDYWADIYDGRFGHVFFGHQPFLYKSMPVSFKHATGLDLGCVHGGHLCAVIIRDFYAGVNGYVTIKAETVYCDPLELN
tara:strand:- start:9070 stop:9834 length:765 start_codon:yes stop_codon:yes gene_type:complete